MPGLVVTCQVLCRASAVSIEGPSGEEITAWQLPEKASDAPISVGTEGRLCSVVPSPAHPGGKTRKMSIQQGLEEGAHPTGGRGTYFHQFPLKEGLHHHSCHLLEALGKA